MSTKDEVLQDVVIKFAGDSGDGMQLTGQQFTNNTAMLGIDLATFPDFPAEIRAPIGTLPGVSGFQLHFSSNKVFTPGDIADVLVAMNAAALKVNLKAIKPGGKIIVNIEGFDARNLRLANYPDGINPLEDGSLDSYEVFKIDVTKLTRESLKDFPELGNKERDRAKNMFVLGYIYWMYNRSLETTIEFLKDKFGKKPNILNSNIKVLQSGYNYGDTTETFTSRYTVAKAKMEPGLYRSIMGNEALAMGLIAAGILTMTDKGVQGGLFAMLAHGLAAAGLFFVADVIMRRTGQHTISASSMPLLRTGCCPHPQPCDAPIEFIQCATGSRNAISLADISFSISIRINMRCSIVPNPMM